MDSEQKKEVTDSVLRWIEQTGITQKDLADKLGMTPQSLNHMIKGDAPFPLTRFLQTAYALLPGEAEVNRVFALYLAELAIPTQAMQLRIAGPRDANLRQRLHTLIDRIPEDKLPALEPVLKIMAAPDNLDFQKEKN